MSSEGGSPDKSGPAKPGEGTLDQRMRSLEERLERHRESGRGNRGSANGSNADRTGFGNALRMSSEFISAILVGAGLGFAIDHFAGTSPWGMIIFLLLGFVAGVVNVLRATGQMANPFQSGWASRNPEEAQREDGGRNDPPAGS